MKKSKYKIDMSLLSGYIVIFFLVYVGYALFVNHSLFRGGFHIITGLFMVLISAVIPINQSKKVSFETVIKITLGFLPFILASIIFLFVQATKMIADLNKITTINPANLAGSIIMLLILTLAILLFSYLSDNTKDKKVSTLFYRILLFSILYFITTIISLFGSLMSFYTYIPGP